MKKLLIIILIFSSCSVLKNKKDIEQTKTTKVQTYRKADTLKYTVPKAIYKDTTIYIKNFEKKGSNTLKITYDKQGNKEQIECISDAVKELTETIETLKDNSKTKDTNFNNITILYIFLGLTGLMFVNKLIK